MSANADPGRRVLALWRRLSPRPLGRELFGLVFGSLVPYTGALGARVLELEPGFVRAELRDRRGVRNHLNSVHAVALANLAEVSSGLALLAGLPTEARAILTGLSVEYVKKARGRLVSECDFPPVTGAEPRELEIESAIRDGAGDLVARGRARWKIGPAPAARAR